MDPKGSTKTNVYVCAGVEKLELGKLLWFLLRGENSWLLGDLFEFKLENTVCMSNIVNISTVITC